VKSTINSAIQTIFESDKKKGGLISGWTVRPIYIYICCLGRYKYFSVTWWFYLSEVFSPYCSL